MSSKNLLESILSALSNEVRAEVLKLISMEGPLSFTEIMERLEMNPKSDAGKFGYHLRTLAEAELIKADESSGKYFLTLLGQDVANFIYGVEDAVRRKKGDMLVRTSSLTIEPFDRKKIVDALIREAGVPRKLAESISKEAEDRLKKLQVRYLAGALVREFVNAILLEKGLEEYRHALTRLGQPVYDVTTTIKNAAYKEYPSPEKVHSLAGDAVIEEYMLLKILPRTIADAHLCGAIHMNNANYWALRPANIQHDLRPILQGKIAADGTGLMMPAHYSQRTFKGALYTLNCLLRSSSKLVSNSQSLNFFNIFLAPYIKGMKDEEIRSDLRDFVYELNSSSNGSSFSPVSINAELEIPQFLEPIKAVGPEDKGEVYGDYYDASLRLLEIFLDVMKEPDGEQKPLLHPAVFLKIRKKALVTDVGHECLEKACQLAQKWGTVYFVNHTLPWQQENVSYSADLSRVDSSWKDWASGTLRVGALDNITLNLPRIAYEANGDDDRLMERLRELLELSREALSIKRQIVEERIFSDRIMPLFKEELDGNTYFRLSDSPGIISYVGLPEAVQYHTGLDLADSEEPLKLSIKIVEAMDDYCKQMLPSTRLLISSTTFEPAAQRLTNLDVVGGYLKSKSVPIYTEHSNLPLATPIPLKRRLHVEESFQKITRGGHLFDLRLEEPFPTDEMLNNYTRRIVDTASIGLFTFTRDYTYCWHCKTISYGFHEKCPSCSYDGNRLMLYTKTFGRYKPSKIWSTYDRAYAMNNQRFTL
ncbi:MAG: helix-turn-helix domain-containing protein [Candidatus Methanomethylicus sp.]|nr:helix-turn-helix domain-containing protein [Candidatus Methanomethylicus sp.]